MIGNNLDVSSGVRFFSKIFNANHAAPAFLYKYDNEVVSTDGNGQPVTGNWRAEREPGTAIVNTIVSGGTGLVLQANTNRRAWFIQNQSTNPLLVAFGSSISSGSFNMSLQACTAVNDGKGGVFFDQEGRYRGAVTISGTSPNYTVWEL